MHVASFVYLVSFCCFVELLVSFDYGLFARLDLSPCAASPVNGFPRPLSLVGNVAYSFSCCRFNHLCGSGVFANLHGLLCVCFTCQRPAHVVFESMCLLIVACPGILWVRLHVQWACCIYGNFAIMAGVGFFIFILYAERLCVR